MDQLQDPFVDNINLNMRKNDNEKHVRPLVKGKDKYGDFFEFEYNEDHFGKFFVVDGQTRLQGGIAAYKRAQDAGDNEARDKIGSINVHFTLTFCVDIYKEAYLFYLINHHVKKIPPEAAITLIEQGHGKKHVLFSNDIIVDEKKNMISTVIELQKK